MIIIMIIFVNCFNVFASVTIKFICHVLYTIYLGITKFEVKIMSNMADARRKMHEIEEKKEANKRSKAKKVKNFFFGCCKNK